MRDGLWGGRAALTRWPLLGEGVAKQKCGTCRFFQEAGLAGSGWCHHPQRKVASGVMIMVRRNELACRDEWSRSLWAPVEERSSEPEQQFRRPPALDPVAPANFEELRALFGEQSRDASAVSDGEDVLLSEARIVSEARRTPEPQLPIESSPRPFPEGHFDPRAAVFRAREAYRDRERARAAVARQSASVEAVPSQRDSDRDPAKSGQDSDLDSVAGSLSEPRSRSKQKEREPDSTPSDFAEVVGASNSARSTGSSDVTPPPVPDPAQGESDRSQTFALDDSGDHRETILGDGILQAKLPASQDPFHELAPEIERARPRDDVDLPEWFRTDLPRICRACRDYRPSADGQRGWCANSWAFTHRRLVQESDVAPCQSAIGDWWVPVDDVWMVAADVSSHGRATPLLDRMTDRDGKQRKRS
jgi:hypothetical protein